MDYQVTCINKQPRNDTHEGITHLGGPAAGGWKLTRADVIRHIETRTHSFFTLVSGKRADIGVVNGAHGKYVQTYADGQWNNNLLALMECVW